MIDSHVANEGDGWAGSGAIRWHLDAETESIVFLTNMGEKESRVGFEVDAGGVRYYLTDLNLKPHETRAIDLRKLRDSEKPDFQGNRIPAAATEGAVSWTRAGEVPVTGELLVLERKHALAIVYDCGACGCPLNFQGLSVSPSSMTMLVGDTGSCSAIGSWTDCNGTPSSLTFSPSLVSWSSSNPAVCTVSSGKPPPA